MEAQGKRYVLKTPTMLIMAEVKKILNIQLTKNNRVFWAPRNCNDVRGPSY